MIIKYNHWEIVHWLVSIDRWYGENLQDKIKSNNFKSLDRHFHAIKFSLFHFDQSKNPQLKQNKKKHFKPQIFVPSTFLSTHKFTIKSPPTSWPIVNPPNMFLRVSLRFRVQATRDHRDVCSSFFPSFFCFSSSIILRQEGGLELIKSHERPSIAERASPEREKWPKIWYSGLKTLKFKTSSSRGLVELEEGSRSR